MRPPLKISAACMAVALGALLISDLWVADAASAVSARTAPRPIDCRSVSSGVSTPQVVSGCNRKGVTGGDGTLTSCPTGTCMTWESGKNVAFLSTTTIPTNSRCPPNLTEVDTVGRVLSASGAGTKSLIGGVVTYDACVTNQINVVTIELVPGTLFTIA